MTSGDRVLGVGMVGYAFMGRAHSQAWRTVGHVFELPKGAGLGVELDEEVIEAHPKQDVHFNLFAEGWERREGADKGANQ